ncbi:MAG: hypothetical protein GC160_23300 [Acidobacteria bacterium]|nr:hypothetical protein [Acidobacteriota bacterium]
MRNSVRTILLAASLLLGWSAALPGVELAFVFHQGSTATVYDASTMTQLGRPEVGAGAFQAIGVPDPADPTKFHKIYVIGRDFVTTLSGQAPYPVLGRAPLTVPVNGGRNGAKLTPNGRWLLVPGGEFMFVFDAAAAGATPPTLITMGGAVNGLAIVPDSNRAFATVEGSLTMVELGLDTVPPQRLAGPIDLTGAGLPTTAAAAPNATAIYAIRPGGVTEVDPFGRKVLGTVGLGGGAVQYADFDRDAPLDEMYVVTNATISVINIDNFTLDFVISPPVTIKKALSPTSNRFFILSQSSQQLFKTDRQGAVIDLVRDPRSNTPFQEGALDIALDRSRRNLFIVFGSGAGLVKIASDGSAFGGQVFPPETAVSVDVTGTPGLVTADLRIYGGDHQAGAADEPLPRRIAVQAIDDQGRGVVGQEVNFTAFLTSAIFRPAKAFTNQEGVAIAEVVPATAEPFEAEARTPGGRSVRFELNTGTPGRAGLQALSGDFQIAMQGTPFPRLTTIRTLTAGVPISDNQLTITPRDPAVTCPGAVATDEDGLATFQCYAAPSAPAFPKTVLVDVTDEFGRDLPDPLTLTVVTLETDLPQPPIEVTRDEIVGTAGETLPAAIKMTLIRASGIGRVPNVGVELAADTPGYSFEPIVAPSDLNGNVAVDVTLPCRLGRATLTSSVNMPGMPENEFQTRVLPGSAAVMVRTQGNGQSGDANQRLDGAGQALVGKVTDRCGNAVPNAPITWEVTPAGAASLEGAFAITNGLGQFSAIVRLGSQPGPVSVIARSGDAITAFDLTINVTPTRLVPVSGSGQQISAGTRAPMDLTVDLLNDLGAGAGGLEVTWSVVEGSGSFVGSTSTLTDAQGRSTIGVMAGSQLGRLVLQAKALDFTALFELTVVGRLPVVSSVGFVNAASFVVGLTPCSAASIFGVGLMEGVDGVVLASGAPFPTRLRGVRVLVDGVEAPILALVNVNGQEQINIQVPCFTRAPSNNVVVTLENNGVSSTFPGVRTFAAQPGIFEVNLPEGRFAAALHADYSLVEPGNPARPGETILVYWTGGGPITPALATNAPGGSSPLSFTDNAPTVTLDGKIQEVAASVYAPTLLTAYQVNIVISTDTRTGLLPLTINMLGQGSPEVLLPIQR